MVMTKSISSTRALSDTHLLAHRLSASTRKAARSSSSKATVSKETPIGKESQDFRFLRPSSNLEYYPHADQSPYFAVRACPVMNHVISLRCRLLELLPAELVDIIVDLAEYWPHTSSILDVTTRVYSGHMNYGSYEHKTRKRRIGKSCSDPNDIEMVHEETGFLLRTPPLGIECTQRVPASATGSTPFLHLWNSASEPLGKTQPASWCLPRPEHPARMIVFEIISREERAEDSPFPRARGNISVPLSKTSFDASIDKLIFRKRWVSQTSQPVLWTAESATELFPATDAKHASAVRGSKLNDPMSTEQTIVDKNTSRHNDKHLVIWRYNDDQSSDELMQNFWGAPTGPELLRSLKIGDSIALWARAKGGSEGRGRACCNIIERVKMHVFWAI